jgi:hypothetical protein
MRLFRAVLVSNGLVLAFLSGAAEAQQNARAAGTMVTLQMPAIPDPARVTLDPKTTALMVLDYVEPICNAQPSCKGQDAAGHDSIHGAGAQGRPHRGLRHP